MLHTCVQKRQRPHSSSTRSKSHQDRHWHEQQEQKYNRRNRRSRRYSSTSSSSFSESSSSTTSSNNILAMDENELRKAQDFKQAVQGVSSRVRDSDDEDGLEEVPRPLP